MGGDRCYQCKLYSSGQGICCNTGDKVSCVSYACEDFIRDVKYNCVICGRVVPMDNMACKYCTGRKVFTGCPKD